jgi:hypothetical protein
MQHLPDGATVAPIIIGTDKTNLTQFSGGKCAYPVYLTLGNLPRAIRRKPSEHACILIAYLSPEKCRRGSFTKNFQRARNRRLFHESMHLILDPLKKAAEDGVEMTGGDGAVRLVFPILTSYVADYPEQCLVTCTKYGTCPKCKCPANDLQNPTAAEKRSQTWVLETYVAARKAANLTQFGTHCMAADITPCAGYKPFWVGFPWSQIHTAITPDVLHQLYQGVFRHLLGWCKKASREGELDRRIRALPPAYGVRHFKNGISALSQVSGTETKAIAKILLGCLVGLVPKGAILACRGLLDFIYLAQYKTHDRFTLSYMEDALKLFNDNRDIFVTLGIRKDFNIPKLHSLLHYAESIRIFGTTDNYNTEMFERLHIDFAKEGWRASNRRDEFPQMTKWIDRREKVAAFSHYLESRKELLRPCMDHKDGGKAANFAGQPIHIAKYPHAPSCSISSIQSNHRCPSFTHQLKLYLNQFANTKLPERQVLLMELPMDKLDVYHMFKFLPTSLDDGVGEANEGRMENLQDLIQQLLCIITMQRQLDFLVQIFMLPPLFQSLIIMQEQRLVESG